MRLVEHLHIAEILREANEDRQRFPAGGRGATVPLSGAKVDPNVGPSGPVSDSLTRDLVDVRTKSTGIYSFSPRPSLRY